MGRLLILIYGIVSYAIGLGGLTFFMLFMGGWNFLPLHIDSRTPGTLSTALLINVSLMILFGVQHSVMARRGFKRGWTTMIPKAAERSTYVLLSGVLMCLICFFWQPLAGTLWHVDNQVAQSVLTAIQVLGWLLAVAATFVINHFELFGLQQVYFHFQNKPGPSPTFAERFMYRFVRHPLQLGLLTGMWSTATMTMTHLMLSGTMTVYIFIGLYYEEKDLVAALGRDYEDYQRRVRMILPIPKRTHTSEDAS
jgi:protein-S-isoprenylcysteine O-methyltransferase Ste14